MPDRGLSSNTQIRSTGILYLLQSHVKYFIVLFVHFLAACLHPIHRPKHPLAAGAAEEFLCEDEIGGVPRAPPNKEQAHHHRCACLPKAWPFGLPLLRFGCLYYGRDCRHQHNRHEHTRLALHHSVASSLKSPEQVYILLITSQVVLPAGHQRL